MARILFVAPIELTSNVEMRNQVLAALAGNHECVGLCGRTTDAGELPLAGISRIVRVPAGGLSQQLRRRGFGGPKRSGPILRELRGVYRLLRLAATTVRLVVAGLRLGPVDIVHANQLDALLAGQLLALRYRARLIYHAHELYMFVEEDPPWVYRAIVGRLEGALARAADVVITTCDPYAEFLTRHFRLRHPALTVLIAPERRDDVPEPLAGEGPLRVIYQAGPDQPSRPVSDVVLAAKLAPSIDVTIRVVDFDRRAIERLIAENGLSARVHIAEPVAATELVDALIPFEVGIILLRPLSIDNELSQPNKLFEYAMAGLAIVAPHLPGMGPLVEGEKIGLTYAADSVDELATALEHLAHDRSELLAMRRRARALALDRFHTDAQRPTLERAWTGEP